MPMKSVFALLLLLTTLTNVMSKFMNNYYCRTTKNVEAGTQVQSFKATLKALKPAKP